VPAVGVLVVAIVVAVFLTMRDSSPSRTAGKADSVELVYRASPSAQAPPITPAALNRTVQIIDARLAAFGIGGAHVSSSGANQITIRFSAGGDAGRTAVEVVAPTRMTFYDWEADVLTPNGKTVASELESQDPAALEISQGEGSKAPGDPGVSFKFTPKGQRQFQNVTGVIARRGDLVSNPGETLDQHFAVALDNVLITVPSINYKPYPDGVTAADGAELTGPFTATSARDLAIELRTGPLPLNLTLICSDAPATRSCHLPQAR